jgi:hypothetical protein
LDVEYNEHRHFYSHPRLKCMTKCRSFYKNNP